MLVEMNFSGNTRIKLERTEEGSTIITNLIPDTMLDDDSPENEEWAAMVNGFEALLLALFDAGELRPTKATHTAIQSALDAISNHA